MFSGYQNTASQLSSNVNPLTQVFNTELAESVDRVTPHQPSSYTNLVNSSGFLNQATTLTDSANNAALTQLLPSNQSVRSVADINVNKPVTNFDPKVGSLSNLTQTPTNGLINELYANTVTNQVDLNTSSRLLSNRLNVNFSASPILSNNPLTPTLGFDT